MPQLSEREREAFFAAPHIAVLSVASDDARPPLTVPIWYAYEPGGNITCFTGTQGHKARLARLIRQAGVVSLCVQRAELPYRYVTVEGRVTFIERPPPQEKMLAIARRYLPEEHAQAFVSGELTNPGPGLGLFTVRPDRWLGADFGSPSE
jgi:nitroimidazol reductase NimA-like FMN-containing flavoprotein (pyridoxamine 5'-phosphate oxidase superfamily)